MGIKMAKVMGVELLIYFLILDYAQAQLSAAISNNPYQTSPLISSPLKRLESSLEGKGAAYNLQRVCDMNQPRNCGEVQVGGESENGFYKIYPYGIDISVEVWCDLEFIGGGWTLFQQRKSVKEGYEEDFDRGWNDYVNGFGNINSSFWAGLDFISELTKSGNMELRIEMEDWLNNKFVVRYNSFGVGNASSLYGLSVAEFAGDYNVGDFLSYHNGTPFSTKDKNNNYNSSNCGRDFYGGWWFNECLETNLNGMHYLEGNHIHENGIIWKGFHNGSYSLKEVRMFLRHKHFIVLEMVAKPFCEAVELDDVMFPDIISLFAAVPRPNARQTGICGCPERNCEESTKPTISVESGRPSTESTIEEIALPKSCRDLQLMNQNSSGLFEIFPDGTTPLTVYCDMTVDGGGWTVFQRRQDTDAEQVDFDQTWSEYKVGFGDKNGSFWLGLDLISKLTESGNTELRIDMEDWEGTKKYAKYEVFGVANSSDSYRLDVGRYSGDAGDSLSINDRMQFRTKDNSSEVNCAENLKHGGWWYGTCSVVFLNGRYDKGDVSLGSVSWHNFQFEWISLKQVEMKLREKVSDEKNEEITPHDYDHLRKLLAELPEEVD